MEHQGTKPLTSSRLHLRAFTLADAPAMFRNWANDAAVTEFLRWPPHERVDVTRAVLANWVAQYQNSAYYQWAICTADDVPVGSIGVVSQSDEMLHIGYCLGRAWWHKGYMREALAAVLDYLFCVVGAPRIESQHDTQNPRSGAVMLACGMRYTHTTFGDDINQRGICDSAHYELTREDYIKEKKR